MLFLLGLAAGLLLAGIAAALVGWPLYRRVLRLRARAQRAERLAELGTLTGGLAHEIKNPLSTVQLNLQLLQEDLPTDHPSFGRLSSRMETVTREVSRLRETLDDFLRYAGRIEVEGEPLELNAVLEELVDFFSPQAQLQKVQIRLKKAQSPITVEADPRLIKQAILNLMINATHAMPAGGDLILSASTNGTHALIDVIDTGVGILPEKQEKIFEAYYSIRKGGTGLGLAMTRRILEEHGGAVTLRSEVGKGSDFTLHLPLRPGQ